MAANVKFLIFAHGNVVYNKEGPSYDREPLKKIRVKTDASYMDLLNAICTKIGSDPSAHQIRVLHRHPTKSVGDQQVRYNLVPIEDDSDVEDLIGMAEKLGEESIQQLYIEISNRSIGLSEHETRQVNKGPRYDIDSSKYLVSAGWTWAKYLVSAGALKGMTTVLLVAVVGQARYLTHIARTHMMTPWFATAAVTFFTDLGILSNLLSISTLFIFMLVAVALLVRRYYVTGETAQAERNKFIVCLVTILLSSIAMAVFWAVNTPGWICYVITWGIWFLATLGLAIFIPQSRKPKLGGLSEHETRQVDATIPSTTHQVPRSKRDPVAGDEDSLCKRSQYDIDSSNDINNTKQEIKRAPEDSPTETGENLVVADLRDDMEEGNQTSEAGSSITPPCGQNYEVFLSFRGDTRHGFTDHLYRGLVNVGVWAFRDNEELHVGKEIGPQLLKAIKGSKISIPIICKNYASSTWCLKELVQILECMKTSGQIVLPILYQVAPSDVKNQTGCFGNGFSQCKKEHDAESKLVQEWKNALMEVTTLKVWESEKIGNGHEAELLQEVVNKVQEALGKKTLRVSAHLVGVESHVEEIIEQTKNAKGSGDVQAIVVHGMGGIGKTTLAKVVYNRLFNHFEGCSFIADIREASQHNGIKKLQKQLISNISGQQKNVQNIDEGADTIKARCERKKVLILLDDVDHRDQLNALAGEPNWFGRGSVIIITSRNKDVLEKWESPFCYEHASLDPNQSFLLFCKHAFKENESCSEDYGTLANDIAETTAGLPLAIEIIGSFLHGKEKYVWEDTLKMLKETPHDDVQRILKISYDALHPQEKEIFLDIACLPIRKRELAIYMWEGYGFSKQRINNLISRSMIKYGEGNELLIHDQLRDFGRDIVRQESIGYIGKRSRIWKDEDAKQVLESKQGTPNVQALCFGDFSDKDDHYTSQQFEGMKLLRFLHMEGVQLTGNFENLFLNLRWLWGECIDIFGINFKPKRLVVLQLNNCNVTEHWTGWNEMKHLKVLELRGCLELNTTPDFSAMEELDVLVLSECCNLREIDSSIGKFSKSLRVLDVSDCRELKELPKEVGKMEELRTLDMSSTSVREIPIFEGYLTKLETLSAEECGMLTELPKSIGKLELLTKLDLSSTGVTQLPDSFDDLYNLEKLSMFDSKIECLPTSIGNLHKLQKLDLCYCSELREIPESIGKLKLLTKLDLSSTGVTQLPDSFGDLYNLEKLSMSNSKIECLPTSIGNLHKLQKLDLCDCSELREIPESIGKLKLLTKLDLSSTGVTQLPDSFGDLYNLEELSMSNSKIECLPTSIGNLHKLQRLDLFDCSELREIPESIGKLKLLTELGLSSTGVKQLPDSFGDLYNLEELSMSNSKIECLPTSIGKLHKLQKLDLCYCSELREIPKSIGKLKLLTELNLSHTRVTELPHSIGDLRDLKRLSISHSYIKILPTSIGKLNKLQELDLEGCKELECLPNLPCSLAFISFNGDSMETLPDFSGLTNMNRLIYKDLFQRRSRELNLGKLNQLKELNIHDSKLQIQKGYHCSNIDVYGSTEEIDMAPENFCLLLELPLSVEQLEVIGCQTLYTLPNLSTLKNLSRLHLQKCSKLLEINGLEGAESLVKVHISACHPEIKIPDLSMLRNLKDLTINRNTY